MTERDAFEIRLHGAVHAYVGRVSSDLDPVELARRIALAEPRRRGVAGRVRWHWAEISRPAWVVLLAALLLVVVAGMLVVGSQPQPTLPAVVPPSSLATQATSTARPALADALVHVTSVDHGPGALCSGKQCAFDAEIAMSDGRLTGCYVLRPTGSTADATWGTATFYGDSACWWPPLPADGITWSGEWFTTGTWTVPLESGAPDATALRWPVDTIRLNGRGDNAGLSAVLRMEDPWHADGWIYPTPSTPPTTAIRPDGSPTAMPTPSTRPTTPPTRITGPVQVADSPAATDGTGGGFGTTCGTTRCEFDADIVADNGRLSGQFAITPAGSTNDGSWGTVAVCWPRCGYPWLDMRTDPITWDGEWLTAGPRPMKLPVESGTSIYPVDTIWLRGRGANEGLSAVLRMWSGGTGDAAVPHVRGWIFPAPPQP